MKFLLGLLLTIFGTVNFAQSVDSLGLTNFSDAVLELQNSELFRNGTLAVSLKSVKQGKQIFSLNQQRSLPSASTLKLVSTATVLSVFGGDHRFQTFLEYDGEIRKDTLYGNIYIRGTGDPSLGSDRFKGYPASAALLARWSAAVANAGIRFVKGSVIPDASFFDKRSVADSWIWADLGNYYGAGVQALNFNENLYKVKFKPGLSTGDPAAYLGTEPGISYLGFTNQVTTGEKGSGDQTILYSNPLGHEVVLTGTVPMGFTTYTVKGSIPDPSGYAAYALKESLVKSSISVAGTTTLLTGEPVPIIGPRKILDEYKSPTLRELCLQTNLWSINLYADSFLKQLGKKLAGNSEYDASAKAATNYWVSRNADMRGFFIKDGSGLSPSGSLTVHNLTEILNAVNRETSFSDFYKSIGILGQTGTVRNLGKGTKAAGNVRAKSGSIEGTRAYAGYVTSKSGELLSFAIIAHKYQPGSSRVVGDELVRLMTLMAQI
ncbi:D-alanyl-D-alanine carboxypeptidase/D-alanyl-D-alanine endopeptidase [Dyadobacter psychrotolerans]|uniref:D-alanyl-D-alanine carboxypeptidase/D-alanyl-D-alanine-endopeptidase n=1 Tax=Dyadobacter psychrotolerans TaxID=2541721 RepID=A0A4R5DYD3_9BACT|nr:D-alanyl-D-alanine carboxypeptidase/D-alanyl-D-alanine-endopeptidase [Dyadobacter psychrotolerans]TDE16365.1 D-alanyl-D-alanine carboxypeptidase/D-alanyl-D-alanine-endopeptidase [Dyadobacter psychrotolerans]